MVKHLHGKQKSLGSIPRAGYVAVLERHQRADCESANAGSNPVGHLSPSSLPQGESVYRSLGSRSIVGVAH